MLSLIQRAFEWQFGSESTMYRRTLVSLLVVDLVFIAITLLTTTPEALAMGLGAAALGGFFGLLFGTPRVQREIVAGDKDKRVDDSSRDIRLNSNFQAISDWLTMGITVLALANIGPLFGYAKRFAQQLVLDNSPFADQPWGAALAILVGYAVLGFAHAFIWANTELITGLREQEGLLAVKARARAERIDRQAQQRQAEFAASQWGWMLAELSRSDAKTQMLPQALFGMGTDLWNAEPFDHAPFNGYAIETDATLRLRATVRRQSSSQRHHYLVTATLTRCDGERLLQGTEAVFLLHPTYGDPAKADARRPFETSFLANANGEVEIVFPALSGFWLGARIKLDDGEHRLRINLDEADGADHEFRV